MTSRAELAAFLRNRRERLAPADVGLSGTLRRRVPGLRREEVAALASISVDYYTRLEQPGGPVPSFAVLTGLARALRMSDDERDHLLVLAGHPSPPRARQSTHVRAGLMHLFDCLENSLAMLVTDTGDVLVWTPMIAATFTDWGALPPGERNLYRRMFLTHPHAGNLHADERRRAAGLHVADLRATLGRRPTDEALLALIGELRAGSDLFRHLWGQRDVAVRRSDRKIFDHPAVGRLELDCDVLLTPNGDQRLVLHSAPPGSPSAERLELLRVLGLQNMKPEAETPSVAAVDLDVARCGAVLAPFADGPVHGVAGAGDGAV